MSTEIDNINTDLAIMRRLYASLPETQENFQTIPAIFGRSYDENFISDYLAYILDPNRNGIGIEPLQRLIALTYGEEEVGKIEFDQVAIEREVTLDDHGRIDLFIRLDDDKVIGIENKITASEGENQTVSYAKGIKHKYSDHNHYLIFLTPDGKSPSSNQFKAVSYTNLHSSLREIQFPVLENIHKSVIWEDFLAHLEGYIIMNEGELELTEKTRLYVENHEMILDLQNAYEQDADRLYEFVSARIKSVKGEGWIYYFKSKLTWQEITHDAWRLSNFRVFFQYHFSRDLLIKENFAFMLGVYPRNQQSKRFIDWLKVNHPKCRGICSERGMESYGPKRGTSSYLIAYKQYPLEKVPIEKVDQQFIDALHEFDIFQPIIDDSLAEFKLEIE